MLTHTPIINAIPTHQIPTYRLGNLGLPQGIRGAAILLATRQTEQSGRLAPVPRANQGRTRKVQERAFWTVGGL
ncbi:hypothetical protein M413DRAFT_442312 [Hebeloma cylindrosporum]|uniref:Uncharacterized protein n=1 Tax=Hebeloma cylindrosporum TaxID=76867 RepID=A0A0C3CPF6_HEBCY|nr:hypothetical protein M413DRAFT_442312 [Hebeloma cylindrosporum h7]